MSFSLDLYYKPNRILLSALGLWPYQTNIEKAIMFIIAIFFIITQGYLQIGGLVTAWVDLDIFFESIPPVSIDLVCYIKIINFIYNGDKMKELLVVMEADWKRIRLDGELEILRVFGLECRRTTIMYAGAVYGSMVPFMLAPLLSIIKGFVFPDTTAAANETIVRPLMFHVEYLVDVEKWHYYILIHSYFATLAYITVVVAVDTMFMAYAQHACSLLAIVGYRLEHLVEKMDLDVDIHPPLSADKPYHNLVQCITQHKSAIQYVDMIESANTVSLLGQTSINMLCISFTGFQAVMKLDHIEESIQYASFMVAQIFPLLFTSYPPQCVTTESERLLETTTRSSWYLTSIRTRKLFNLMILRCTRPCELTAGRFYVLNIEYFSTVMRTSMSYLTMLCSFREAD